MQLDTNLAIPIFMDWDIDLGKAINSSNICPQNKAKTIPAHFFFVFKTFCQNHHFVGYIILIYIQQEK